MKKPDNVGAPKRASFVRDADVGTGDVTVRRRVLFPSGISDGDGYPQRRPRFVVTLLHTDASVTFGIFKVLRTPF